MGDALQAAGHAACLAPVFDKGGKPKKGKKWWGALRSILNHFWQLTVLVTIGSELLQSFGRDAKTLPSNLNHLYQSTVLVIIGCE